MARLQPDTPTELAEPVRKFANQLMDIGARSVAGIANADPDQAARLKDADATNAMITTLCKLAPAPPDRRRGRLPRRYRFGLFWDNGWVSAPSPLLSRIDLRGTDL